MSLFSQERRHLRITTVLGKDALLVEALEGEEAISRLFTFQLSLVSENQELPFDKLIGTSATVTMDLPWGGKRFFNGIISRFSQVGGSGAETDDIRVSHYSATVVPLLWLLSVGSDSRIFQHMSVPEIVQKVLTDHGCCDFQLKLLGDYQVREYCVQYRESPFSFISRLLEEEGIHYFFEHSDGKHQLILADAPQANLPCPHQQRVTYQVRLTEEKEEDFITSLDKSHELRAKKLTLADFNFKIPNSTLQVELPSRIQTGPGSRELYEHPGRYRIKTEGDRYARLRMEEEESQHITITGESTCRAFGAGFRFTLNNHYRSELAGKEYLLTRLEHRGSQSVQKGAGFEYQNSFDCIPAAVPFRPARVSAKPVIPGTQSAIVVGPAGEEIHVDEHGRVKVQFHWDREGNRDENSSCWIRVSQAWAGSGWGGLHIPRIGQEVVVSFMDGDPDSPIITGQVYHGVNRPPYPLPMHKTKSTIRSNSSQGGGGFNEFRFEDKKGEEEIYLHGEKDWNIEILNDKGQRVGHDETLQVANNRFKAVGVNQTVQVGANHSESIGANKRETVAVNKAETIGAAKELTIGGLYQVSVGAAMNETVVGAKCEEVGLAKTVLVAANMSETVAGDRSLSTGRNLAVTVSGNSTHKAKRIMLEAEEEIVFKTGSAVITLASNGEIVIKGAKVTKKATGEIVIKGAKTAIN